MLTIIKATQKNDDWWDLTKEEPIDNFIYQCPCKLVALKDDRTTETSTVFNALMPDTTTRSGSTDIVIETSEKLDSSKMYHLYLLPITEWKMVTPKQNTTPANIIEGRVKKVYEVTDELSPEESTVFQPVDFHPAGKYDAQKLLTNADFRNKFLETLAESEGDGSTKKEAADSIRRVLDENKIN